MLERLKHIFGEALAPRPQVALGSLSFALFPQIVRRAGRYYLRYQIQVPAGQFQARQVPFAKKAGDKGYYFFGTPISLPELDHVVASPVDKEGLTEFAEKNAIYWLNPDGSEVHLEVLQEGESQP